MNNPVTDPKQICKLIKNEEKKLLVFLKQRYRCSRFCESLDDFFESPKRLNLLIQLCGRFENIITPDRIKIDFFHYLLMNAPTLAENFNFSWFEKIYFDGTYININFNINGEKTTIKLDK